MDTTLKFKLAWEGKDVDVGLKVTDAMLQKLAEGAKKAAAATVAGMEDARKSVGATSDQVKALTDNMVGYTKTVSAVFVKDKLQVTTRELENGLKASTEALGKMDISAKQTAAALRGVSAQFTDIVTSLQAGQAPLSVFLQQGGQLKDMFGGAGNAARALGGYVLGLVSPFSVTAAALAVLGYGYLAGAKESENHTRAIIQSGNAAGVTAGQMQTAAQSIGDMVGTQGQAAAALDVIAQGGAVGAANLERFTAAAIQWERITGTAIDSTAKSFSELKNAPLAASVKLNESMNYLTTSIYSQIKALTEQGRSTDAADLAQKAFADTIKSRAGEMEQQLGWVERSWRSIKDAVLGAGDAMKSIGRADGLDSQIAAQRKMVEAMERPNATMRKGLNLTAPVYDSDLAAAREQLAILQESGRIDARRVANRANEAELVKLLAGYEKQADQIKTKALRRDEEIQRVQIEGGRLVAAGLLTQAQLELNIASIREKYADKSKIKVADPFAADRAVAKEWAEYYEVFSDLTDKATGKTNGLSAAQVELQKYLVSPAYADATEEMRQLVLQQAYGAITAEEFAKSQATLTKAQTEFETMREAALQRSANEVATLNSRAQALEDETTAFGLGRQAIEAMTIARLKEQQASIGVLDNSKEAVDLIEQEIAARMRLAQAQDALNTKEATAKAAKQAQDAWEHAAEKIESSIADALMRGFESGKGFLENLRDYAVNMFKTLVLRPIVSAVISPVAQGVAGMVVGNGAVAGQGGGGLTDAYNATTSLDSLKGWLTDFGGGVASQVSKLGNYLTGFSNSTVSGWGEGLMNNATAIGQYASVAGNALGYLNAAMAASEGRWGAAIGSGIGTYFGGPIGAAIGNAIGGWVDNAFGGGHEYTTGEGISGRFGATGFSGRKFQDWRNDGSSGFFGIGGSGSSSGTNYSALETKQQDAFGTMFANIKNQTAGFALALGLSATSIEGYSQDIRMAFGADAEANKVAISQMFQGIANAAAATVLDPKYMREGEAAADTLARLATNLTVVNGSFDTLDKRMLTISQSGGDVASQLVDAMGGLQQYQGSISAYYLAFYSEEERLAKTREQTSKALADLGIAMPTTLQGYRDLVNAQDVSTASGRKTYAALIGLSTAFASVTTEVDTLQTAFTQVARSLRALLDSIASERTGVADARSSITGPKVYTLEELRKGVSDIAAKAAAPSTALLDATAAKAATATTNAASADAAQAARLGALVIVQDKKRTEISTLIAAAADLHALADSYGTHNLGIQLGSTTALGDDSAYAYNAATNRINGWLGSTLHSWTDKQSWLEGGKSTTYNSDYAGFVNNAQTKSLLSTLNVGNSYLAMYDAQLANAQANLTLAKSVAAAATTTKVAADLAAQKAALAYTDAVTAYVVEASKSVPALTKLREETMKYYEAQKALAETMGQSATNLRAAVKSARADQLDPMDSTALQQREFAKNYALALSTSGADKAGYADKLTSALPGLSEALKSTMGRADWLRTTARLFAQSNSIAAQLEATAPHDYQAESLGLLDSIDNTLAQLDDSTAAITRAIQASGGLTAEGLRQVVEALGGTPAFASGGYHSGGLRLVGENGPELEVTGPSRIFSAGQTAAMLRGGHGGNTARLEALVEQQTLQLEALRTELRAIATHSANTAESTRSMDRNGVLVYTDPAEPLVMEVVA